jgi:hypothetical protein
MGSHHELLKDCEVYKEIAESQLSQVELAQTDRIVNANVKEAAL